MVWVDKPQNYLGLYQVLQLFQDLHLNNFPLKTLFVGACDVHETQKPGLNISYHLPKGLKFYRYRKSALKDRNLTYQF